MSKTHLIVQIAAHFLLAVFYLINLTSISSSYALLTNETHGLNSSIELNQDDPLLINATSDIPIWDSSNTDNDSINETLKMLIDNLDNLTTPVFMVPDELDSDNVTITTLSPNGTLIDLITTSLPKTTSESTVNPEPTMSTSLGPMNESKVFYETTTKSINEIETDKRLNEPNKSDGGSGTTEEDTELLPGDNQASRVACTLDGDLICNGSVPTCYGSGYIDCSLKNQESSSTRKRSAPGQRFSMESSVDRCNMSGDIICSSMVTQNDCKGSAVCKVDKMEETMMAYNYWQIVLIAGALAIICVTIILVGIVGYFSWTKYKVRPEANGQANQVSDKA